MAQLKFLKTRVVGALLACCAVAPGFAANYSVTPLYNGWGNAINNQDQVAGSSLHGNQGLTAYLWSAGVLKQLGGGSGTHINNLGDVVGYDNSPPWAVQAMLWSGSNSTVLGRGLAVGINDAGTIIGGSIFGPSTPMFRNNGAAIDFGDKNPSSLNNAGQFAASQPAPPIDPNPWSTLDAFRYSDGAWQRLWTNGSAVDINEAGDVVGQRADHAVLWSKGVITDLGVGYVAAINNLGQVALNQGDHAKIWQAGVFTDLGEGKIEDINDHGVAVGEINVFTLDQTAVLWTPNTSPVPEAETYAMLLGGLALLAAMRLKKHA